MTTPMSIVEFGDSLLRSGDLDPVYIAVYKAKLDDATKLRLMLGYVCFYHLGVAARLAEQKTAAGYWKLFHEAVVNEGLKWPRGSERRHFRGANALNAYNDLHDRYKTPEAAMEGLVRPRYVGYGKRLTFAQVSASVQKHVGFGPWSGFKIADIAERLLGYDVDFSDCALGIYKDPRQGAAVAFLEARIAPDITDSMALIYAEAAREGVKVGPWDYPITNAQLNQTIDYYVKHWRDKKVKAPPANDRLVGVAEIETVLCKYKSHLKGNYPLGKDTREIRHALYGWGDLALRLREGMPS